MSVSAFCGVSVKGQFYNNQHVLLFKNSSMYPQIKHTAPVYKNDIIHSFSSSVFCCLMDQVSHTVRLMESSAGRLEAALCEVSSGKSFLKWLNRQ